MFSAMRRNAGALRPALLRFAMVSFVALATMRVEPAAALRNYGFDGAPPAPSLAEITHSTPLVLFNTKAVPIPTNRFRDKWAGLLKSVAGERNDMLDACGHSRLACDAAATRWLSYLAGLRGLPKSDQIALVNRYVNWHIQYADDDKTYGAADYWASPFEAIGGRGDCEDFAVAKYFSLILLGFSDDQIRLVIVRDVSTGALHALTTVSMDSTVLVLDNRLVRVVRDTDISMYKPIYSFNQSQNWVHVNRAG
jgi:predicted transglutaminase-like cysteine proteinase